MDAFSDRMHDPLLFLSSDKNELDTFLMNSSSDMGHLTDDLHVSDVKMENSLDLDSLEGNGHLGDMNWLHNSSLSTLAHLDGEDTSDGTNLISVNPQSVLPMQIIERSKPDNLLSSENANSAAMRLHANCSNLLGTVDPEEHIPTPVSTNVISQEHQTIRILSVASQSSNDNSPVKTQNYLITSTRDSPLKSQTYVLNTSNGSLMPGLTVTTASSPHHKTNSAPTSFVLASPQKFHAITSDKSGRVLFKAGNHLLSPSQASPVLLGRLQTGVQAQVYQNAQLVANAMSSPTTGSQQASDTATVSSTTNYGEERAYPKPVFSYSCLIALALKNSKNGSLPVSEIYNFMCENFPYFKTAPDGWKNSVRHNLSLNKCFAKVDNPKLSQGAKKGCLWALNPAKIAKMEDEISKWGKKDPAGLLSSMAYPENLDAIEKGQAGLHYSKKLASEQTPCTPIKGEATPTKVPYAQTVRQEYGSVKIESFQCRVENDHVESETPIKNRMDLSPHVRQTYSPTVRQGFCDSPILKRETLTPDKIIPDDFHNLNHRLFASNDSHSTINTDALADIVLQNGIWENDDLENEIDIDLICDSPSNAHLPIQSPLPTNSSPTIAVLSHSSGHYSPSVQSMYTNYSTSLNASPTPASVRNNLFGVSTPTCRTLYA